MHLKNFKRTVALSIVATMLLSTCVNASPYHQCDDFNAYMKETLPLVCDDNMWDSQGLNTYQYRGTCGQVCQANAMNILFGTDYTEQDFVHLSLTMGQCTTTSPDASLNGGQSAAQLISTITQMGNMTGHPVAAEMRTCTKVPSLEECAALLNSGKVIIMGVDLFIMNDISQQVVESRGVQYYDSNHWVVLKSPVYKNGQLVGFNILDSCGSYRNYIDYSKLNASIFGPTHTEIPYCAAVIVSKI